MIYEILFGRSFPFNFNSLAFNSVKISRGNAMFGGGISMVDGTAAEFNQCKISGNVATEQGGGIASKNGKLSFNEVVISECVAYKGGGLFLNGEENILSGTAELKKNVASDSGGGIFLESGELRVSNVYIRENSATNAGGGIFMTGPAKLFLSEMTIYENTALKGGGIAASTFNGDCLVEATGAVALVSNKASSEGGNFHGSALSRSDCYSMNIKDLDINSGEAPSGAGVFLVTCSAELHSCKLNKNKAVSSQNLGKGGGLYSELTQVSLFDVVIENNEVQGSGAGIYMVGSTASISA